MENRLQDRIEQLHERRENEKAKLTNHLEQKRSLEDQCQRLLDEKAALEREFRAQVDHSTSRRECGLLEERLKASQDHVDQLQACMTQERELLQARADRLEDEKKTLIEANERLTNQQTDYIRVLEQKRSLESQYQRLLDDKAVLERDFRAQWSSVETKSRDDQLQRECDRLLGEKTLLEARRTDLQQKLRAYEDQIEELKRANMDLRVSNEQLKTGVITDSVYRQVLVDFKTSEQACRQELEQSRAALRQSSVELEQLQQRELARTQSVVSVGRTGELQLQDILQRFFGGFGELLDTSKLCGRGDFVYQTTLDGTAVKILIESKTRDPNAKTVHRLSAKETDKFLFDCTREDISAGFLCSRRPVSSINRVEYLTRAVLLVDLPLELTLVEENLIVGSFTCALIKGLMWEREKTLLRQVQSSKSDVLVELAQCVSHSHHELSMPLRQLNTLSLTQTRKIKQLVAMLQQAQGGSQAASILTLQVDRTPDSNLDDRNSGKRKSSETKKTRLVMATTPGYLQQCIDAKGIKIISPPIILE